MLEVDWTLEKGWTDPVIKPAQNLSLHPFVSGLHYGLQAFEGMKAYYGDDKKLRLFRPEMNMARLAKSMKTLAMPELSIDDQKNFLSCIEALVKLDSKWIPKQRGFSLYLRPTVIGTHPLLGVNAAKSVKLYVVTSPAGPYYPEGFKPIALFADDTHVRAWPGGAGSSKLGGNYAPTIAVQREAAAKGYSQILWLFGPDHNVTEAGTMNFFVVWRTRDGKTELVTAPLDGTILPGVTRASILELAKSWGNVSVVERPFTIAEVIDAINEHRLMEAFGAGTAAVVSPVKMINFKGVDYKIPLDEKDASAGAGPIAARCWKELLDIQYGTVPSNWAPVIA
jgi:branched-chain amino acid aminotransferase